MDLLAAGLMLPRGLFKMRTDVLNAVLTTLNEYDALAGSWR